MFNLPGRLIVRSSCAFVKHELKLRAYEIDNMSFMKEERFFACVNGIDQRNFFLDLYLPRVGEIVQKEHDIKERDSESYNNVDCDVKRSQKDSNIGGSGEYSSIPRGKSSVPLVIFVHGGGWRRGAREAWRHYLYYDVNIFVATCLFLFGTYGNIGEALVKQGIGCAVISYPLTEASPVYLCFEMMLSYLQSCLILLPVTVTLTLLLHSLNIDDSTFFSDTSIVDCVYLTANILTLFIMCTKRHEMKINLNTLRAYLIILTCSVCTLRYVGYQVQSKLALFTITFVLNQAFIFIRRISRCKTSYEHQLHVLAQAISWAKHLSRERTEVDSGRIFLMGHSAGGHLASLITIDGTHLTNVGCSPTDIKGVISLSGVYCLKGLCKRLLRPLYLEPTFGQCPDTWLRASPVHLLRMVNDDCTEIGCTVRHGVEDLGLSTKREICMKQNNCGNRDDTNTIYEPTDSARDNYCRQRASSLLPPFLLMSAEKDGILKTQSIEFYKQLSDLGVKTTHVEIKGSNHFTIITGINNEKRKGTGSVLRHVTSFIYYC